MSDCFTGSFTQQEPLPDAAIEAALAVLRHGRLHRYNLAPGEAGETALLEADFAGLVGARYCVAVASGGYALATALRALGVAPGDPVLANGFTLAPVPGAIAAVGARPVFVDIADDLTIDLDDLAAKAGSAKVLILSHMRGHICNMERLMAICSAAEIAVVEDCAHTMGAAWDGTPSGRHGAVGCYSCQTYKHVNSGEGGLLVTDDDETAARAILLSGSYMLYDCHLTAPPAEVFERLRLDVPNISGRMDNLRAALLRPQLAALPGQVMRWNRRYRVMERGLADVPGLELVPRDARESFVGSSFQFRVPHCPAARIAAMVARCAARGVALKWFGAPTPEGYTSTYRSWRYAGEAGLPNADRILAGLIDMRLPLTFSEADCTLIARIIREEIAVIAQTA